MKRKWLLLAVPLALALALIPLSRRQRDFIHLFERVPTTEGCAVMDDGLWIAPAEIACFAPATPSPNPNPLLMGDGTTKLEAVEITTGARRKLPATSPQYPISGTWGVMTSPDGKWILWPSQKFDLESGGIFDVPLWSALSLDGTKFVQRPRVADSISSRGLAWLPDSSGWVEVCVINRSRNGWQNGVTLRVCSLNKDQVRKIDVPQAKNANKTFAVTKAGEAVIGCDAAGLQLFSVPLMKPGAVRSHTVALPARFNSGQIIPRSLISPRGDRIAWTFHDTATATVSLWLSDIHGKKFEPIAPNLQDTFEAPRNLRWTPDGKALSCWRLTPGKNPKGSYSFYRINIPSGLSLKP